MNIIYTHVRHWRAAQQKSAQTRRPWKQVGSIHLAPTSTVFPVPVELPYDVEPEDIEEVIEQLRHEP